MSSDKETTVVISPDQEGAILTHNQLVLRRIETTINGPRQGIDDHVRRRMMAIHKGRGSWRPPQ